MNDQLDKVMKDYFSERQDPTDETKVALRKKLNTALSRRESRVIWFAVAYDALVSVMLASILWIFVGDSIITIALISLLAFTLLGIIVIVIGTQIYRMKGGADAFSCD